MEGAPVRVVLAFDPGGRNTGIVVRARDDLLASHVAVRTDDLTMPDGSYTRYVTGTAIDLLEANGYGPRHDDLIVVSEGVRFWPQQLKGHRCPKCEGMHDPTQGRTRNLTGLLGTAIVHGAVMERWPSTVVVPPGVGHGSLHNSAYPEPIRARGKGSDRNQHARSAWDASYHGETLLLQQQRQVTT